MEATIKPQKVPVYIEEEMRESFMAYAMSVIISRALPDVRDGLKPVHRRVLDAMYDASNTSDQPTRNPPVWSAILWVSTIPMATRRSMTPWCAWPGLRPALSAGRRPGQLWFHRRRYTGRHALHRDPHDPLAEEMLATSRKTPSNSSPTTTIRSKNRWCCRRGFPIS